MKSELTEVVGLYDSIFKDLVARHHSIHTELRRDLSRLRDAGLRSGLPLYTIVLPSLDKFLLRSLDKGVLEPVRPPLLGAKSKVDLRPKFLYGLWVRIFERDGTLRADVDITSIAELHQVFLAAKKLRVDCEERYVKKTISDFVSIERHLPTSWNQTWDDDHPVWVPRTGHPIWGSSQSDPGSNTLFDSDSLQDHRLQFDWESLRRFTAKVVSQFGELDVWSLRPKHGPGAISDKSSHTKYDLLHWTKRLDAVFPYDWFGAPNPEFLDYFQYREFPSRLYAVPKTQSGPRLIAAEPTAHQWIQGGIQRWLEERVQRSVLRHSIDFGRQDLSKDLALRGSSHGRLATIDLSSASDRLTTRLVEYVFQSNRSLLDALHACRTRVCEVSEGELILLRKFSTQGSACTFPVQTIVFSILSAWACAQVDEHKDLSLDGIFNLVRVFGDDIIIPSNVYPVLVPLLEELCLKVNESKSFVHGLFRESCGMDAYAGVDVTPAYYRQVYGPAPTSLKSVVECSNNFYMKGWWHTADYLLKTVPAEERVKLPTVAPDSGAFGVISYSGSDLGHLRRRWNDKLQRFEVKVIDVKNSLQKTKHQGHGGLLQFFSEFPDVSELYRTHPRLALEKRPEFYDSGEVSGLRSSKTTRWVAIEEVA